MSNPLKVIKKNFKKIVTVAIVAGAIYLAWPAIVGAMSGAGAATTTAAAAGGGVAEAGMGAAIASAGSGAAAAGTAAGSGGLIGSVAGGLSSAGSAIAGASPLVKMGLIQVGGSMLQGAMTPKQQTAAEIEAERLALYHNQPTEARTYSTNASGNAGLINGQAVNYQNQFSAPSNAPSSTPAPVATLNQQTGVWERAS